MRISLMKKLRSFRSNDEGVTLVEYGIALVVAVTIGTGALMALSQNIDGKMTDACNTMASVGTTTVTCP